MSSEDLGTTEMMITMLTEVVEGQRPERVVPVAFEAEILKA